MAYKTHTQQALFAPFVDEQVLASVELEDQTTQQAQAVVPEDITTVEISFYDHKIYAGDELIAQITYDHNDFVTQPWLVMVNSVEIYRADTWARCNSYIQWHHKQGTLPIQKQELSTQTPATTGSEVIASIAIECEKFGFVLEGDGSIYHNDVKLGEVGCTEGRWWVVRASSGDLQVPCDSALDAVWSLWMAEVTFGEAEATHSASTPTTNSDIKSVFCEELLDLPFDELTLKEWKQLKEYKPLQENVVLVAA
ncbi:MAG: hypothetical protein QNJ47_12530 [Nostocaceae cyanobacterium]|nr:hypothetical protein [Nostocaceae cyanobacterium]